eukprot:607123_1
MTHQQREMGTQRSMPYFAQITQITNEAFVVRLDVLEMNRSKRRQYDIREINKPNAEELERLTIPRKSLFGTKQVYFDDDGHGEKLALGVFDRNKENPQLLSNIIHIVAHPSNAEYPPTQYKPKAVDVSSIKKVLDEEHQTVHLYWNVPALSLGDIEYKIIYNPNDDEKDNAADVKDDIVHVLPHSIPLELLPIQIQIITMCKFDKATFYSEPSDTIDIGNLSKSKPHTETTEVHHRESAPLIPDQTNPTAPSVPEIGWDVMPHYFMQIVSVDEDEFSIKLIPNKLDAKKRKFVIRDWIQSDVKKQIKINKNKESGTTDIRIDDDHADVYQLALFHEKHNDQRIPNSNQIQFTILKDKNQYPPANTTYKPNPIDLSTVLKVKDEANHKVHAYWSIPPKSFGDIAYQIVHDKDDIKQEEHVIQELPYTVPWHSDAEPISFQVITVSMVQEMQYKSDPSKTIVIGENAADKTHGLPKIPSVTPATLIKSWDEYPNLLQVLGVDDDTIKLRLSLKPTSVPDKQQKYYIQSIGGDQELYQKLVISKKQSIIAQEVDAEPGIHYELAVFLDKKQISNAVKVQTSFETFNPNDNNYTPLPPSKETVQQYYDADRKNVLIMWSYPQLTFGDDIKYKIQRSDKAETEAITQLPYTISLPFPATIKLNVSNIAVINDKEY